MPDLDPPDPLIDAVIDGRYHVVERIGAGGMGTVYRAQQLTIGRDVAVKFLRADAYGDPRQVRRFEREAQMIARLRDPHTLKLIDFGRRPDGQLYLVTEFLDGEALDARLGRGPIGAGEAIDLLRPVCDALAEAHAEGIVHRDLKPGNLFVERVGARELVKVLDFGIARWSEGEHSTTGVSGTPAYMAPEQARGQSVDHRCDLYALGAVLYACLSGRAPYMGSGWAVMLKVMSGPPTPFDALAPPVDVAPGLAALVFRLMAPDPADRPQSVVEVAAELDRLRREVELAPALAPALPAEVTAETLDVGAVAATGADALGDDAIGDDATEHEATEHEATRPAALPSTAPVGAVSAPVAAPVAPTLDPPTIDAPRGEAQRSAATPRRPWGPLLAAAAVAGGIALWLAVDDGGPPGGAPLGGATVMTASGARDAAARGAGEGMGDAAVHGMGDSMGDGMGDSMGNGMPDDTSDGMVSDMGDGSTDGMPDGMADTTPDAAVAKPPPDPARPPRRPRPASRARTPRVGAAKPDAPKPDAPKPGASKAVAPKPGASEVAAPAPPSTPSGFIRVQ